MPVEVAAGRDLLVEALEEEIASTRAQRIRVDGVSPAMIEGGVDAQVLVRPTDRQPGNA